MPRKTVGEACIWSNYEECPLDTECATQSGSNSGLCTKRNVGVGEACREIGGYPQCNEDAFCRQEGDPNSSLPPGTCTRRVGLGGTCTRYGQCQQGLRCSGLYTTGTCIPAGKVSDICNGYGDCELSLYCSDQTSRCARYPGDGGDCSRTYNCDRGFYCDYVTDLCRPKRADGAPCVDNFSSCTSECSYGPLTDGGNYYRCAPTCSVITDGGV